MSSPPPGDIESQPPQVPPRPGDIESQPPPLPPPPGDIESQQQPRPLRLPSASLSWLPSSLEYKLDPSHSRGPTLNETADIVQYNALMRGGSHPRRLRRFYRRNGVVLFKPLSSNMDTPFHIAAIFGDAHLLQVLLRIAATYPPEDFNDMSEIIYKMSNYNGDNILHEVAAGREVKVLELLTKKIEAQGRAFLEPDKIKQLLEKKNFNDEETPIFKASALAGRKMLRRMIGNINPADLSACHLHNNKNQTILEIAILGQKFDSAIWLIEGGYLEGIFENDKNVDIKCLDILANMPHAFKSGYKMGIWHALIYILLPVDIMECRYQWQYGIVRWVYYAFRLFGEKVILWPINKVWKKKKTHSEAVKLLNLILDKGKSWKDILSPTEGGENRDESGGEHKLDPMLLAASNGIVEMVTAILYHHPIAIENSDARGWNLLHVAAAYRQESIFSVLIEDWALPVKRLVTKIMPASKYTVLHQVSDTYYCSNPERGMQFGPALQLQDELRWYERVEDITPNTIQFNRESNYNLTARELFTNKHKNLHETAQEWLKNTSQNCSTVAVLIAGVAFAGACTVPGDYSSNGHPNLLRASLYKIFTASDVVALTTSLASVVVFLSILTSPLPMRSFRHSLPQKLMWGFAALFVSVTSTMLAFMAAVMLVIGMKKKEWTTSLAYATVFLPVLIMGIVQFPLVYLLKRLIKPAVAMAVKKTVYHVTSFLIHFDDIKDILFPEKRDV